MAGVVEYWNSEIEVKKRARVLKRGRVGVVTLHGSSLALDTRITEPGWICLHVFEEPTPEIEDICPKLPNERKPLVRSPGSSLVTIRSRY
jgi:hypothetical protein